MKLIITKSQAKCLLRGLTYAYNDDYDDYDPMNAQIMRLYDKISKELERGNHE